MVPPIWGCKKRVGAAATQPAKHPTDRSVTQMLALGVSPQTTPHALLRRIGVKFHVRAKVAKATVVWRHVCYRRSWALLLDHVDA